MLKLVQLGNTRVSVSIQVNRKIYYIGAHRIDLFFIFVPLKVSMLWFYWQLYFGF